jgi:hypothetical protein
VARDSFSAGWPSPLHLVLTTLFLKGKGGVSRLFFSWLALPLHLVLTTFFKGKGRVFANLFQPNRALNRALYRTLYRALWGPIGSAL